MTRVDAGSQGLPPRELYGDGATVTVRGRTSPVEGARAGLPNVGQGTTSAPELGRLIVEVQGVQTRIAVRHTWGAWERCDSGEEE